MMVAWKMLLQTLMILNSLDAPGKGIAYYGITLIPPISMQAFISAIKNVPELSELKALVQKAYAENKWIIHFGL